MERDPGNPCLGNGGCQPLWRLLSAAPALEAVQLWQQGFSFTFLIKAVQYQRRWEFWPTFSLHFSCIFFTKALAAPNRIRLLFFFLIWKSPCVIWNFMVKQVAFSSPKITTPRGNFPYGLEGKSMVQKNAWQSLKNRHWMLPTYGWNAHPESGNRCWPCKL